MKTERAKHIFAIALIAVLGLAIYGNSLGGKFIWDDKILIEHNEYIKDMRNIPGLFTKNITHSTSDKSNFYRPLQMLTYALNYALAKHDTKIYHLTNIVFHILAAAMLYWLTQLLLKNTFLSLTSSLIFISHPIHTEAVTYISGRADPMAALFMLLTLIFYIKSSGNGKRRPFYILSIISYLLALLCKEIALITPLLLAAYDYIYKERKRGLFGRYLPFALLAFLYIALRKTVLNFPHVSTAVDTTFLQRIPVIFQSLSEYFMKLALPLDLHMKYKLIVPLMTDIRVIGGAAIIAALIITAARCRKNEKIVSFSIAWFFINYLPVSNIYPLNAFFAEHWIYIPSLGLSVLAGWAAMSLCRKNRVFKGATYVFLAFLLGCNSYLTVKQNLTWKDPESFYKRTLRYAPVSGSANIYFSLSLIYFENNRIDDGIKALKKALEIKPDYADARYNLGTAYMLKGRHEKALIEFKKAVSINPGYAKAHFNLSAIYFNKGRYDLAIKHCDKAVESGYKVDAELLELLERHRR